MSSKMHEKTIYRAIAGVCGVLIASAMFYALPVQAEPAVLKYEVDPFWAKLPDNWVVGPLGGVCVDAQDHVLVLHRQEELTEAVVTARDRFDGGGTRIKAPPVMEFDANGNLINSWGDTKLLGSYLHDCQADKDNNLWIAAARSGFVQKYASAGTGQPGRAGRGDRWARPGNLEIDSTAMS